MQTDDGASTTDRPLVVAGGSAGTGGRVAALAQARGRQVRLVQAPERCPSLPEILAGAAGVVLVPGRGVSSGAAQARALLEALGTSAGNRPAFVLVSGFSVGHGLAHRLNAPDRLADRVAAEEIVRAGGGPYTIVRPTWLNNDPPGRYALTLSQDPLTDGMVARDDLAAVCLAAVDEPLAHGTTFAVHSEPGEPPAAWWPLFAALMPDAVPIR
jgi:uncharacterized protein YbjT (DUF2867 family)